MPRLVTRFHVLLLSVTVAITAVALLRVPEGYAFSAHWQGGTADWLWPRDAALAVAPLAQLALIACFLFLGRALTRNHLAKTQHIFDPALTLLMLVVAGCQLGLLLNGVGSDLDFIRFTGLALGIILLLLGMVLFGAERHTYAGLRLPWPIADDSGWKRAHRTVGIAYGTAGLTLIAIAWLDPGMGLIVLACLGALLLPPALAGLATLVGRR